MPSYAQRRSRSNKKSLVLPNLGEAEGDAYYRISYYAKEATQTTGERIPLWLESAFEGYDVEELVIGYCWAKPSTLARGFKTRACHEYTRRNIQIALHGLGGRRPREGLRDRRLLIPMEVDWRGRFLWLVFMYPVDETLWQRLLRLQTNDTLIRLRELDRVVADPFKPVLRSLRRGELPPGFDPAPLSAPGTAAPPWEEESAYEEFQYENPRHHGLYWPVVTEDVAVKNGAKQSAREAAASPSEELIAPREIEETPMGDPGSSLKTSDPDRIGEIKTRTRTILPRDFEDLPPHLRLEYECLEVAVRVAQQERGFSWKFFADCMAADSAQTRLDRLNKLVYAICVVREHEIRRKKQGKRIRSWTKTLQSALTCDWKLRPVADSTMCHPLGRPTVQKSTDASQRPAKAPITWHPSALELEAWREIVESLRSKSEDDPNPFLQTCAVEQDGRRFILTAANPGAAAFIREGLTGAQLLRAAEQRGYRVELLEVTQE